MDSELDSIRAFLAEQDPFEGLPGDVLDELATQFSEVRAKVGAELITAGKKNRYLYVVRSGAVEVLSQDESLLAQFGEGDVFGQRSLLSGGIAISTVRVIEAGSLLRLDGERFHSLCDEYPGFRYFFGPIGARRLRGAVQIMEHEGAQNLGLLTTSLGDFITRPPICIASDATIRAAAQMMKQQNVSSLMVLEDGWLKGILTDRDLRNRVLASGLPYEGAVGSVMTSEPLALGPSSYAHEALLAMARSGISHLPVVDDGKVVGMVTVTDLVQRQAASATYLIHEIDRRSTVDGLVEVSHELPKLLGSLVAANASAHSVGHLVTSLGEAITTRLLSLGEEQHGSPPIAYAWLAAGSQARREQTAYSDQDNCLLLSDDYDPKRHGKYFEKLTRFVCEGLDACGYIFCPGEIMAMTSRWRQPLATWKRYFSEWIDQPDPGALVNATVFFDIRCLHGEKALFDELQAFYLEKATANRIFVAFLAANALHFQPPLGFFRNFVLVKGGEQGKRLDLKHRGVVPIIDLARVYALSRGIAAVNSRDRLEAAAESGALSSTGAADLRDALEFIGAVRLRHQARQIREGIKPDNFMAPGDLSHFERNHLKDAFAVVSTMQSAMGQRYQSGRFG